MVRMNGVSGRLMVGYAVAVHFRSWNTEVSAGERQVINVTPSTNEPPNHFFLNTESPKILELVVGSARWRWYGVECPPDMISIVGRGEAFDIVACGKPEVRKQG